MADVMRQAEIMRAAQKESERLCSGWRNAETSFAEERALGRMLATQQLNKSGHLFLDGMTEKDPAVLATRTPALASSPTNDVTIWVAQIGLLLAKGSSRPALPWVFGVIDNETPQAFSTPGGYVFVTTGLLKKLGNEAQLAGVLAHEIAHVASKHGLKGWNDAKYTGCNASAMTRNAGAALGNSQAAAELARASSGFPSPEDGFNFDKLSPFVLQATLVAMQVRGIDKLDEFDADATALHLVAFAGYDASEYEKFLVLLGPDAEAHHPKTDERVAKLKTLREGELAPFVHGAAKPQVSKALSVLKK